MICDSRPASARIVATYSAAVRSPGPELSPVLLVSILISSLAKVATLSSAEVLAVSPAGSRRPAAAEFSVISSWSHPGGLGECLGDCYVPSQAELVSPSGPHVCYREAGPA